MNSSASSHRTIRPATYADLPAISRLASRSVTSDYGFYPAEVQRIIRARNSVRRLALTKLRRLRAIYVASVGERILGYLVATPNNDDVALVYSLYVSPEARGLGLGAGLIEHFEATAVRPPVRRMMVWTEIADGYYTRLGWRLAAELPDHWWGQTFYIFVRDIDGSTDHATIPTKTSAKNGAPKDVN